ncbi:MAG: pilus assembly protein [Anaerolineaceae bacterium]|nr:pilus assembly protein [Anaerolineaceae bacterium]
MAHTEKNRKQRNWHKGQSLVEVAVSLTLLLILLAGSVDVGRVFLAYISLRDAAQEGVAFGSVYPTYCNQIVDRTIDSSPNMFTPTSSMVDVSIAGASCASANPDQACIGNEIRITITNPAFPLTMPFIGAVLGEQTIPLSATVRDTILRPPCP